MLAGLGLVTLLGFGGVGWWLSAFFHGQDLEAQLGLAHRPWAKQVLDGLLYGGIASANILWLLHNRILAEPRHVFGQLVQRFKLGVTDMVFLSLCAGIGEEWFFRGAIQPWLGIWITAIAFVALHGYLSPGNLGMFLYGVLMTVIVAGFGYLTDRSGLIAAMTAHALIDVAIFGDLSGHLRRFSPGRANNKSKTEA